MTPAQRLRSLFQRRQVTAYAVAQAAGIPRQRLSEILRGVTPNPGILTVERIVEAAGGTMVELYDSNGSTQPNPGA